MHVVRILRTLVCFIRVKARDSTNLLLTPGLDVADAQ